MDIIEQARALGRAIQQDERYLAHQAAARENDQDAELQELINQFNMKRIEITQEMTKSDKDDAKMAAMDKEFKELYQTIMERPSMVKYNAAKQDLEEVLAFVNQIIAGSVQGLDPNEIEENSGCTGSCSSCAGCH